MDDGIDLASTTCYVLNNRIFHCGDKALSFEGDGRQGHPVIKDNIISDSGIAVALKSGCVVEEGVHNTVVGNEIGIRIYAKQRGSPGSKGVFRYSIVWHNTFDVEVDQKSVGVFANCDIGDLDPNLGLGNIEADPLFVNEPNRCFALSEGSPCILEDGSYMGAVPPCDGLFVRGDANRDWKVDLSDPLYLLLYIFGEYQELPCADAGDVDDNGEISLPDVLYLLTYLYAGGSPPPNPFPFEGRDPTADDLLCGLGESCR